MYTRPDVHRRRTVVPENYGGVAFSGENEDNIFVPPPTDTDSCECCENDGDIKRREPPLPIRSPFFNLDGEDLLLLGLIFLLAQSDLANDIIPLLIILLLC